MEGSAQHLIKKIKDKDSNRRLKRNSKNTLNTKSALSTSSACVLVYHKNGEKTLFKTITLISR